MSRGPVRRLAVAGTALAAVLLAGCGGTDANGRGEHVNGARATPSASAPPGATVNAADVKFATEMIPHHQQALEMARVAETRATNAEVKALATRIKKAQDPEIATMSGWLRQWGQPVPSAAPGTGGHAGMPGMMSDQELHDLMATSGTGFDRMFLQMMIRHHQGAIEMANTEQQQGRDPQSRQLAAKIAADQTAEIKQMQDVLAKL